MRKTVHLCAYPFKIKPQINRNLQKHSLIECSMITTKFYLDCRASAKGKPAPLKLAINKNGSSAYLPLNIKLTSEQWNKQAGKIINHPQKTALNTFITQRKLEVDAIIIDMIAKGQCKGLTATDVKNLINEALNPDPNKGKERLFVARLIRFAERHTKNTADKYLCTLRRMRDFRPKEIDNLTFEDITREWLTDFDTFLMPTNPSRNARNIHFRNIRAVFNDAIDDGITTAYPFRKFKLRPEPTRKRSMPIEVLRKVLFAELPEELTIYRDIFKLLFCLIGINIVDLCNLMEIEDGRVNFMRAKTHKPYSIKVEPEALEIINRLKGENHLLYMLDHYKTYRTFYMRLCYGLADVKKALNAIDDGIEVKELTTYWSRHTWATVAASLDIPKDTIAAGLGHGGNTVTDIYIDFDRRKVDEANRKVLDWVFYHKR